MNEDIAFFGAYSLSGKFLSQIKNTLCYNHFTHQCHHFIKNQHYTRNPQWYVERKIKQRLIYMPVKMHQDLHSSMTNERFYELYEIERKDLLYSRKDN